MSLSLNTGLLRRAAMPPEEKAGMEWSWGLPFGVREVGAPMLARLNAAVTASTSGDCETRFAIYGLEMRVQVCMVISGKRTAAILAWRPGGSGVAPFPLTARRLAAEREDGGPGGFRQGVGNTVGLGEADNGSDIVRGEGGREMVREESCGGTFVCKVFSGVREGETG